MLLLRRIVSVSTTFQIADSFSSSACWGLSKPRDMSSNQRRPSSDDQKKGVNSDLILEELGPKGRYQVIQLLLNAFALLAYPIPVMDYVFTGYQPDYQCREVENVTELMTHSPSDVTNFTLHDVKYRQCSIDVTLNSSVNASSFAFSLPCVAGINFSMPVYTSFLTEWSLVCERAGLAELTQSGFFGGQIVGAFVFSMVDDRYGRKKVYIACAFSVAINFIIMSFVPNYYFFLVCKIASGVFNMGMEHAAYTMFMELMPQQWRHVGSFLASVMWTVSCLILALLAYCLQGVSWRYLILVLSLSLAFSPVLPWHLDESLRWLIATGDVEQAEKILKKACQMNNKDFNKIKALLHTPISTSADKDDHHEISTDDYHEEVNKTELKEEEENADGRSDEEMNPRLTKEAAMVDGIGPEGHGTRITLQGDQDAESLQKPSTPGEEVFQAKYTVLDLFQHRVVLVPFLVTVFVWITANTYFYVVVLGSANLSGNRFLNFSLLNLQDIPSSLLALFVLSRFNRRPLAFTYHLLAGIFLLVSVGLVASGEKGVALTLATVAQYVGLFCLTGSYILFFVYYMEIYPTAMRAVGTGTAGTIISITDIAAPFLLLWAERNPWAPGVFLGSLCCLASMCIWILPETRHRQLPDTIEEIKAWRRKDRVV